MKNIRPLKFKIHNKESLFDGFFQLNRYQIQHELFAGGWNKPFRREVFERGQAVAVLLLDLKKESLVLIEQFRPGAIDTEGGDSNPWLLELVAGMIEENELPEDVVKRETLEEAGCEVIRLTKICEYFVSPGGSSEKIWLYLGEINAENLGEFGGLAEENEDIKIHLLTVEKAFNLLDNNRINNAMTLIGLQWLRLNWGKRAHFWL